MLHCLHNRSQGEMTAAQRDSNTKGHSLSAEYLLPVCLEGFLRANLRPGRRCCCSCSAEMETTMVACGVGCSITMTTTMVAFASSIVMGTVVAPRGCSAETGTTALACGHSQIMQFGSNGSNYCGSWLFGSNRNKHGESGCY